MIQRSWVLGVALGLLGASAMATSPASAQQTPQQTRVILGTATPGGGFPLYGSAVVDTVHEVDPSLVIEARNTKGSTENVPLLEAGTIDLGLIQGEVAYE